MKENTINSIALVSSLVLGVIPTVGLAMAIAMGANGSNKAMILPFLAILICIVGGFISALVYLGKKDYKKSTVCALVSVAGSVITYLVLFISILQN